MIRKLPVPGMQDTEESRQIAADVPLVTGQRLDRLRRGQKQSGIGLLSVSPHKPPQLPGNGKSQHEVRSGQMPMHLFVEPVQGFVILTVGAMPISATMIDRMNAGAFFTLVCGTAVGIGFTVDDRLNDFELLE